MIKLLPILLAFSLAHGENTTYLLPDENTLFSHTLERALKHSRSDILIIAPALHHPSLKRAAIEGAKRGSHLTLIVQTLKGDPLSLAQYERTDIRILNGRPLDGSIVLIDQRFACTMAGTIDQETLPDRTSLVRCTDDKSELTAIRQAVLPLLRRSKPYLK